MKSNIMALMMIGIFSMQAKQAYELKELDYKSRNTNDIEFGVLTVGFNNKLAVDASELRVNGSRYEQGFAFEGVRLSDAQNFISNLKKIVQGASQEKTPPYNLSATYSDGRLRLLVDYDPSKVDVAYELAGKGQKAVFHFRDKAVLKALDQFVKRQTKVAMLFDSVGSKDCC